MSCIIGNSLLQFLSSEDVSNTLLYWINCFPFGSCQEVKKLTDLRDAVALSEILINVDENYFKDLKTSQVPDKNLWLLHLVQLKKLFLKLSAYVELYLKQDWSLLPVPDFKLVARSEETTSHLNFMVAAVLLTATHSGKNLEYEKILELVIPTSLRKEIQNIQNAFLMALEPKSPKSSTNSPRRTSLNHAITSNEITPKVLFPSNLSLNFTEVSIETFDISLQEIKEKTEDLTETKDVYNNDVNDPDKNDNIIAVYNDNNLQDCPDKSDYINLQNEVKLLEIKLTEMEKLLQKSKDEEISHLETSETLKKTRERFNETFGELQELKERQKYEKIERNSLMAAFDEEKQILVEEIENLKREIEEKSAKITNLTEENLKLNEELKAENIEECKLDNSKLVKALNKARDHILKQDAIIKELKSSEAKNFELLKLKDEELKSLKESYELERTEMNRIMIEIGRSIQKTNL